MGIHGNAYISVSNIHKELISNLDGISHNDFHLWSSFGFQIRRFFYVA